MAMTIGVMTRLVSSSIKDGKESGEYTKVRSTLLAGIGSNFCASVFSATNSGMSFDDALPVGHRKALDVLLAALQNITFVEGAATLARRGTYSLPLHTPDTMDTHTVTPLVTMYTHTRNTLTTIRMR